MTVGQTVGAWTLREIKADRIVLSFKDRVEEIMIDDAPPRAQ